MADLNAILAELAAEYDRLCANPDLEAIQKLDARVKDIFPQTVGNDELKSQARDLLKKVTELRLGRNRGAGGGENMADLLRTARNRIDSGVPSDMREALSGLAKVLQAEPENADAFDLLYRLATSSPALKGDVRDLLRHSTSPRANALRAQLDSPADGGFGGDRPPDPESRSDTGTGGPWTPPPPPPGVDVTALQSQMQDLYYAGDYKDAVKLCTEILRRDPNNDEVRRLQAKAEDYIMRGVVPDTKIPLEARTAFNRGTSAVRAGMYDQAKTLFTNAIRIAKAAGVTPWEAAETALLNMENLDYAKELRDQGEELMKRDKWEEALQLYESSLNVVDDNRTRHKLDLLTKVSTQYKQITVRLNTLSGQYTDMAAVVQEMRNTLAEAQQELPTTSPKLQDMQAMVTAKSREIGARLLDTGMALFERATNAAGIDEQLRYAEDAYRNLNAAHGLLPDDVRANECRLDAQRLRDKANDAHKQLEESRKLLSRRESNSLNQARAILDTLSEYPEDAMVRSQVANLLNQVLEQAQISLSSDELEDARNWLNTAEGKPFSILGRSPEVSRIAKKIADVDARQAKARAEEEAKTADTQRRARYATFAKFGGIVAGTLLLVLLTRSLWQPALFPPPTPTPTLVPTATATLPPTETPVPTLTFTPAPTPTPIPTNTPAPTNTPVSTELCRGVTKAGSAWNVRSRPDATADRVGFVAAEKAVIILDQTRDKQGKLWYKIQYGGDQVVQQGWISAEFVIEATLCPRLP